MSRPTTEVLRRFLRNHWSATMPKGGSHQLSGGSPAMRTDFVSSRLNAFPDRIIRSSGIAERYVSTSLGTADDATKLDFPAQTQPLPWSKDLLLSVCARRASRPGCWSAQPTRSGLAQFLSTCS
jgi:hypothetical protein